MAIDWNSPDLAFLRDQLEHGRVILFAGAGFSLGAMNRSGEALPLGNKLAQILGAKAGLPYQGESLANVYEAVGPILGGNNLWKLLSDTYSVATAADWYQIATGITWHRIYTTNIDNLFQFLIPFKSKQRLKTVVRGEPSQERDPDFEELQCIHLHGHIDYRMNGLTFTPSDFARHTAKPDPWYQELVADIQNCPVIFTGTTLDEPILSHYLELREPKEAEREWRPKSYLVSPNISPIKMAGLRTRNIIGISATAQEFFESIAAVDIYKRLDVRSVAAKVFPHHFVSGSLNRAITQHFDLIVPTALPPCRSTNNRFFLGAEPTWEDIEQRHDGDREINKALLDKLLEPTDKFRCLAFLGPAGSGKTTSVMRVAHELASQGKQVFFSHATNRLELDGLLELINNDPKATGRVYVVIDVVSHHVGSIGASLKALQECKRLTLVVIERTNRYGQKCQRVKELDPEMLTMPDLTQPDIESILERLERFGFSGVLKGKPKAEQLQLFMERARHQLLVAMREATSGKNFDLILQGEFEELESAAQLAYVICCIAVSKGAPGVYVKHLSPCLPLSGFKKGFVISELLRGVLIPTGATETMIKPRHNLIASLVSHEIAPLEKRLQALRAFLMQIASFISPNQIRAKSPAFLAYRGMINSDGLRKLLDGNSEAILDLYKDLQPYYGNDYLFWLQYGMAQIDARNYDEAENFLNQSLGLYPTSFQTLNHLGILYLLQATDSPNPAAAQAKANEGMNLIFQQIRNRGDIDKTPHSSYLAHVLRWYLRAGDLIAQEEWEALRVLGNEAKRKHRIDDEIKAAADAVELAYLRRAIHANTATI